jgi:plasmid maintenance system antidote protein VapI
MFIVRLASRFDECPDAWCNMIRHLQTDVWQDVPESTINRELRKFNAKYDSDRIIFEREADYLMWILRWWSE